LLLLDSLIVNKHNEDIGNCQALIYFDGICASVIKLTRHTNTRTVITSWIGLDYIERYHGYINWATEEDTRGAAREYLHHDNCVLVIVADLKKADIEIQ
jgi:hypothetical protein